MSSHRSCKGTLGMSSENCINRGMPVSLGMSLPSFQKATKLAFKYAQKRPFL